MPAEVSQFDSFKYCIQFTLSPKGIAVTLNRIAGEPPPARPQILQVAFCSKGDRPVRTPTATLDTRHVFAGKGAISWQFTYLINKLG